MITRLDHLDMLMFQAGQNQRGRVQAADRPAAAAAADQLSLDHRAEAVLGVVAAQATQEEEAEPGGVHPLPAGALGPRPPLPAPPGRARPAADPRHHRGQRRDQGTRAGNKPSRSLKFHNRGLLSVIVKLQSSRWFI